MTTEEIEDYFETVFQRWRGGVEEESKPSKITRQALDKTVAPLGDAIFKVISREERERLCN